MGNALGITSRFPAIANHVQPYLGADGNATAGGNGGGERGLHLEY